jgi:phosphomethylpyrimidine synthase
MDLRRNDVEELSEISSDYGKRTLNNEKTKQLRFEYLHKPMRQKSANVSIILQKDIITPEMEYIAIENHVEQLTYQIKQCVMHPGHSWGAKYS